MRHVNCCSLQSHSLFLSFRNILHEFLLNQLFCDIVIFKANIKFNCLKKKDNYRKSLKWKNLFFVALNVKKSYLFINITNVNSTLMMK